MACQRFTDALRAHAAGADLAPDVRAHVERCDDCRLAEAREKQLLAGIGRDLTRALRIEPSVEFEARVLQQVAAPRTGRSWLTRWRLAAATASLVLVGAITATIALRTGTPPRGPEVTPASATTPAPDRSPVGGPETPVPQAPVTVVAGGGRQPAVAVGPDGATRRSTSTTPFAPSGRGEPAEARTTAHALPARPKAEPEVLVPPDRRLALDNLIAMIRAGKIDESLFPTAPAENSDAASVQAVTPIVIEGLKVPPINVPAFGSTEKRDGR